MLLLAAISYGYDLMLIVLFALEKEKWLLKREVVAVLIGGGLGLIALLMQFPIIAANFPLAAFPLPLLIVLLGAILAETFMVIVGLLKIKKFFANL